VGVISGQGSVRVGVGVAVLTVLSMRITPRKVAIPGLSIAQELAPNKGVNSLGPRGGTKSFSVSILGLDYPMHFLTQSRKSLNFPISIKGDS
jgi:hypothetical protein